MGDVLNGAARAVPDAGDLDPALGLLPHGLWIMTACFEDERRGIPVRWVQRACAEPPLVSVAFRKGDPIEPLIRDSRGFALCQLSPQDDLVRRRFEMAPERLGDPFDVIGAERMVTGAPIIRRAVAALDCEVYRRIDLEGDHALYVGLVVGAEVLRKGEAPLVCVNAGGA